MIEDLIKILEKVKEKITDDSNVTWTRYNSGKELRTELEISIEQLRSGDFRSLSRLHGHFLPTSTFQDHSISNGWDDEYMGLSEKFDSLYEALKTESNNDLP